MRPPRKFEPIFSGYFLVWDFNHLTIKSGGALFYVFHHHKNHAIKMQTFITLTLPRNYARIVGTIAARN